MSTTASNNKAALTGIGAGILGYLLGPLADRRDTAGNICFLLLAVCVCLSAYFFVFGIKRKDMVRGWMFKPSLVKRVALWFAGLIASAFVLTLVHRLLD